MNKQFVMKQKPILFLLVALMVSAGIVMYPETGILQLKNLTTEEGNHPKNVYLSPLSVNCPSPMVLAANANCMAELIISPPSSTCGRPYNIVDIKFVHIDDMNGLGICGDIISGISKQKVPLDLSCVTCRKHIS